MIPDRREREARVLTKAVDVGIERRQRGHYPGRNSVLSLMDISSVDTQRTGDRWAGWGCVCSQSHLWVEGMGVGD